MNWSAADFLVAGLMLALMAGAIYALFPLKRSRAYRAGLFLAVVTSILLFWVSGAVGLVGSAELEVNLAYPALLLAGFIAACIFRFRSSWLSRIAATLALAIIFLAGAALLLGWGTDGNAWPWDIILGSGIFAFLFMTVSWLFGLDADIRTLRTQRR